MAEIFFPLGRMIGGNVYELFPQKDSFGKPKLRKDGTPAMQCAFGVAFPKEGGTDWRQTEWGREVYKVGSTAFPQHCNGPLFAWKVTDGDSTIPNKRGKIPAQLEGYAGHWVIWFNQGWLPKLLSADGMYELGPDMIYPGCFVRVLADVTSNNSTQSPGVYMNPKGVFLLYEGERIVNVSELDTSHLNLAPPPMPAGAKPISQKMDGQFYGAPAAPAPDRGFLRPPAPPAPPAPTGPIMTPVAVQLGYSYESLKSAGWSDEQMRSQGWLA